MKLPISLMTFCLSIYTRRQFQTPSTAPPLRTKQISYIILVEWIIKSCTQPTNLNYQNITPVHKNGDKLQADNCGPMNLTLVVCKLMEVIIRDEIKLWVNIILSLSIQIQFWQNENVSVRVQFSYSFHIETSISIPFKSFVHQFQFTSIIFFKHQFQFS